MNDLFNTASGKCLCENILETIDKFELLGKGDNVLIALSGGADSVFLTYLFYFLKEKYYLNLSTIHINHNLRGEESSRDELFSQELSKKLGIPFYSQSVDVYSYIKKNKKSLEEAARELRYDIFLRFLKEKGFNKLAMAHNLDDLAETFFYRVFKGSGVGGLISIPIKRKLTANAEVIRPLLFLKKSEIVNFLSENKILFVFDSSNSDNKFARNYIRNKISPLVEKKFPSYREKIKDLYLILYEEEKYWDKILLSYERFISREDDKIILDKSYKSEDIVIKRRLIRKLVREIDSESFLPLRTIDKIISFQGGGTKIIYNNKNISIMSEYGNLYFTKKQYCKIEKINLLIKSGVSLKFLNFLIKFDFVKELKYNSFKSTFSKIFFNADQNNFRLRNYKNGDRIKISNDKTKKLSDIFIDEKISRVERNKGLVVENKEGEIVLVFIPGKFVRVSFDFYVDNRTKRVGVIDVEMVN